MYRCWENEKTNLFQWSDTEYLTTTPGKTSYSVVDQHLMNKTVCVYVLLFVYGLVGLFFLFCVVFYRFWGFVVVLGDSFLRKLKVGWVGGDRLWKDLGEVKIKMFKFRS